MDLNSSTNLESVQSIMINNELKTCFVIDLVNAMCTICFGFDLSSKFKNTVSYYGSKLD